MEETKLEMLQKMAKQDAEVAHEQKHKRKRTRKPAPKVEAVAPEIKVSNKPRKIRATFHNRESKGAPIKFSYNLEKFNFEDGKEYEMPIYVLKHLNSLSRTINEKRVEVDGITPHRDVGRKEPRFAVIPVIYDGDDSLNPGRPIYHVSY